MSTFRSGIQKPYGNTQISWIRKWIIMNRRLRIIMDPEYKIQPDTKTNWVTNNHDDDDDNDEWLVCSVHDAMKFGRDTLVIQP